MDRILLLNNDAQDRFNSVSVDNTEGMTKHEWVEKRVLDSINQYNPKLNVSRVEYMNIEEQFSNYEKRKPYGLLIEQFEIKPELADVFRANECYVSEDETICRRILMYVFLSMPEDSSRTSFVSESIFPGLLAYAQKYINSPSYSFANHDFLFINLVNKSISAPMIKRHLAGLCIGGMHYVEITPEETIRPALIPRDMRTFLKQYVSRFDETSDVHETDNYIVDIANKTLKLKTDKMKSSLIKDSEGKYSFKGSAEKFIWIEWLSLVFCAYDQGYKIDYSEFDRFVSDYRSLFSARSDKMVNCVSLLEYMKKYFI